MFLPKLFTQLLIGSLCFIVVLVLPLAVEASGPQDGSSYQIDRPVSLSSTAVDCLAVEAGSSENALARVRLEWEGQIEQAYLVLSPAGSEAEHSLYINGQLVGKVPVQPEGRPCQADFSVRIPISPDVLVDGHNEIMLTNDANISDSWTAADLHLEIEGVLSGPPVGMLIYADLVSSQSQVQAMAVITGAVALTSSYDGVQHTVWYQGLDSSCTGGGPAPLLLGIHGYGKKGYGIGVLNSSIGAEARARCWLLAAPDMHNRSNPNHGEYAFAWPGAQHDIIDAIEYMMANYAVDSSRIYIAGGSMGGQTTSVMTAKYPDIFAAAVPYKGIADAATWYYELPPDQTVIRRRLREETDYPSCNPDLDTDVNAGCGTPQSGDPNTIFEYQRRSALVMARNSQSFPIKMWHAWDDQIVPITQSIRLKSALQSWNALAPVTLIEMPSSGCSAPYHCYSPDMNEMFDFLASYTRSTQPPESITILTDESKPYYWLNVVQAANSNHWTEIEASYDSANKSVTAKISDTLPLTLSFNLGSVPINGVVGIPQSGLGLDNGEYLVTEIGGNVFSNTHVYASGYLTVALHNTGQITLTIAAPSVVPDPGPGPDPTPDPGPDPNPYKVNLPLILKN